MTYAPRGLDFDGSSDYLARGDDLTGNADVKQGILSLWFRLDGGDGAGIGLIGNTTNRFYLYRGADDKLQLHGKDSTAGVRLNLITTPTYTAGAAWYHVLAGWDLSVPEKYLYIDDAAPALGTDVGTDAEIDYTRADWGAGSLVAGGSKFNGAISELYFTNEYLDFSTESNRRKFIDASGNPVWLGTDGSLPTGTAPLIYMDFQTTGTNKGSGGNFTENGSPNIIKGPIDPKTHTARAALKMVS